MNRYIIPSLVAIGSFVGGVILDQEKTSAEKQRAVKVRTEQINKAQSKIKATAARVKKLQSRINAAGYKDEKKILAELSGNQISDHLDWLFQQIGPDGMSDEHLSLADDLLDSFASTEPELLIKWLGNIDSPVLVNYIIEHYKNGSPGKEFLTKNIESPLLMGLMNNVASRHDRNTRIALLNVYAESSPVKAFQLALTHKGQTFDYYTVGLTAIQSASTQGAETLLKLYQSDPESSILYGIGVSDSLPYDADITGFSELWMKDQTTDKVMIPRGLWQAWAEQRPDEAFDFLFKEHEQAIEPGPFYKGFAKSASQEEVYLLTKDLYEMGSFKKQQIIKELKSHIDRNDKQNPAILSQILAYETDDYTIRSGMMKELVRYAQEDEQKTAVLDSVGKEQHMEFFQALETPHTKGTKKFKFHKNFRPRLISILKTYGHSDADINLMLKR